MSHPSPSSRTEVLRASPPMFADRRLDALTRVHPAVPVAVFVPLIALLAAVAVERRGPVAALLAAAAGYAVWTLAEYWIHRAVFHLEPEDGIGARLHWMVHGVHHDHPNDPMRLVMPPAASLPLAAAFYGVFALVAGVHAPGVAAGFLAGYLAYDMLHFHLHHHRPRTRLGRRLRELHMRHHFQDHTSGYGISAPYWDRVFGTAPPRRRTGPAS
jgi:sterol desaturase/sphingolipid hydroxylase (fatty acid hydroxylase superfamily)